MSEFFEKMFFLITSCGERASLDRDVFINDEDVNRHEA